MLTRVGPSENKNYRGSLYTCFSSIGFGLLALSVHPSDLRASEIPMSNSFDVTQELLHQYPQEWAAPSCLHEGHEGKDSWQGVSRTPSAHILSEVQFFEGNSLEVQRLGLSAFIAMAPGATAGQGMKIPQAKQHSSKNKKPHSFKIWKVTVPTIVLLVSHLDDWASPLSPLHFLHTRVNLTVPSGHHAALKPPGGPQFLPKLAHPLQTIGFALLSGLFPLFLPPILLSGQIPHSLEIAFSFPMTMSVTELPSATNIHYVLCF